jgi:hypothetical protein
LESKRIAANKLEERERVGVQAVYIDTLLLSYQRVKGQREHFLAPPLFKRAQEIEKYDEGTLVRLMLAGQVCEGLKQHEIFSKYTV